MGKSVKVGEVIRVRVRYVPIYSAGKRYIKLSNINRNKRSTMSMTYVTVSRYSPVDVRSSVNPSADQITEARENDGGGGGGSSSVDDGEWSIRTDQLG